MRVFEHQFGLSANEIDLKGKKYMQLPEQRERIRPEKCHVPGGHQTTQEI